MIRKRTFKYHPQMTRLPIREGQSATIQRNGKPFVFVRHLAEQIEYGPVGDNGQVVKSERVIRPVYEGLEELTKFLNLNTENEIKITISEN